MKEDSSPVHGVKDVWRDVPAAEQTDDGALPKDDGKEYADERDVAHAEEAKEFPDDEVLSWADGRENGRHRHHGDSGRDGASCNS